MERLMRRERRVQERREEQQMILDEIERNRNQNPSDNVDRLVPPLVEIHPIGSFPQKNRKIILEVVEKVAEQVFIPLSVGGGVRSVQDATDLRLAGAEKINVNSAAVLRPGLIDECAQAIGSQNVVLSMDILRVSASETIPSGYEIVINGGRRSTGIDAVTWALMGEKRGAGELVVNSIDADGTRNGYDITLTKTLSELVRLPVIASGGAGNPKHLLDVLTEGKADAALVASMVHYGDYSVSGLKTYLHECGVKVRMSW